MSPRRKIRRAIFRSRVALTTVFRFFGPVVGAVRGEFSKEERLRALAKAVVVGSVTHATLWASLTAPESLSELIVPLAAALLSGLLDAVSRYQQGDARPTLKRDAEIPTSPLR